MLIGQSSLASVDLKHQYLARLIAWHLTDSEAHKPRVGASEIEQAVKMQSAERIRCGVEEG